MNIIVPIKQVPDLVEELELNDAGTDLDREWLRFKVNEFDEHALEEALQIKEDMGANVTVIALDGEDMDKALFTTAAKGADTLVKVTGDFEGVSCHGAAQALANAIKGMSYNLILIGVQSVEDRDGQTGVLLAHYLGVPHVSVVTSVNVAGNTATVHKEYAGGIVGEFEVDMPAVLGIQAARETPRYAPVSKVRRAMRSSSIDEVAGDAGANAGSHVTRMFKPDTGAGAEMINGDPEEVATKLLTIIRERGI